MNNLYICMTLYHIFYTILRLNETDNNHLILMEPIENREEIKHLLVETGLFDKVSLLEELDDKFVYTEDVMSLCWKEYFKNFNDIFLFNDSNIMGDYIHYHGIIYRLLDDGRDSYLARGSYHKNYLKRIKYYFRNRYCNRKQSWGFSPYCKSIEVNNKMILERDKRWNKYIEVPFQQLIENASNIKISALTKVFPMPIINNTSRKKLLLLTQPLYESRGAFSILRKITSLDKQLEFYKSVIESYKDNYDIYIKPHPRDNCDYSSLGGIIINKAFPIELIEYISTIEFDIGITYFSTSLANLSCVKEKIMLVELRKVH